MASKNGHTKSVEEFWSKQKYSNIDKKEEQEEEGEDGKIRQR